MKRLRPGGAFPEDVAILKEQAAFYTTAAIVRNVCTIAAGIVLIRWVPPEDFGVWQTLLLAQTYLAVIRLGVVNGMNRELAFLSGKGETEAGLRTAATAQAYSLACAAVGFALAIGALFIFRGKGPSWISGITALAVIVPSEYYYGYLEGTFWTSFEFDRLARVFLAGAVLSVATVPLAYLMGFSGYCLRAAILSAFMMILCHFLRPIRVRPRFDRDAFRLLLSTGLPLYGQNYLGQIAGSMDRLILLSISNVSTLGLYGPSMTIARALNMLSDSLATYLSPRLAFLYGRDNDKRSLFRPSVRAMAIAFLGSLPVAVIGWFLLPPLVQALFPMYADGIFAMRMGLLAGLFMTSRIGMSAPCMMKAWRYVFAGVAVLFLAKTTLPWLTAKVMGALDGVAAGNAAAAVVVAGATLLLLHLSTRNPVPHGDIRVLDVLDDETEKIT